MVKEFRENLKLSDYLNKILMENDRIYQRNKSIQSGIEHRIKYHPEYHGGAEEAAEQAKKAPFLYVPSEADLVEMFGGHFEDINILAKIGVEGKKVHKVTVHALDTPDGYIIYRASSYCGSQRWSQTTGGRSPIFPISSDDLSFVNCDKCLGIRVKGGKDADKPVTQYKCGKCGYEGRMGDFRGGRMLSCPKCRSLNVHKISGTGPQTRSGIDPNSRPKKYTFEYLVDRPERKFTGSDPMPASLGEVRRDYANGMTAQEAWDKYYRSLRKDMVPGDPFRYYDRVYDARVVKVSAWNGNPLWSATNPNSEWEPGRVVVGMGVEQSKAKSHPGIKRLSPKSHRYSSPGTTLGSLRG